MGPKTISNLFSGLGAEKKAYDYLEKEGVLKILSKESEDPENRYRRQYCDLARLHKTVSNRNAFTILEFGIGFSTIVMAHALNKNKDRFYKSPESEKPKIRCKTLFELHVVDASEEWIQITKEQIPEELVDLIHIHQSDVKPGYFEGRICHFFDLLPKIIPDFIYLDGPGRANIPPNEVADWSNGDTVMMSGDILRIEPLLLPGAAIIVDGRTANARFLESFFFRKWKSFRNSSSDVTVFELQEPPLGKINKRALKYCLGTRALKWD